MEIVQVVELLCRLIVGRRLYWLQTEPEQLECFVLCGVGLVTMVRGYLGVIAVTMVF
jgi:hypothetical protein